MERTTWFLFLVIGCHFLQVTQQGGGIILLLGVNKPTATSGGRPSFGLIEIDALGV